MSVTTEAVAICPCERLGAAGGDLLQAAEAGDELAHRLLEDDAYLERIIEEFAHTLRSVSPRNIVGLSPEGKMLAARLRLEVEADSRGPVALIDVTIATGISARAMVTGLDTDDVVLLAIAGRKEALQHVGFPTYLSHQCLCG
jgi:hypothetical protein